MPMYEFRCEDNHVTEKIVKFDEESILCEKCGKPAFRIISVPGKFQWGKAGGWT